MTFTNKLKARLKPKFSHRKNADVIDAMVEVIDRLWMELPYQHALYKLQQVVENHGEMPKDLEAEIIKQRLLEHQRNLIKA